MVRSFALLAAVLPVLCACNTSATDSEPDLTGAGAQATVPDGAAGLVALSYEQWTTLPLRERGLYLGGAFDYFTTRRDDYVNELIRSHFVDCMNRRSTDITRLAVGVTEFVDANPSFRTKPVSATLIKYLVSICGLAPL